MCNTVSMQNFPKYVKQLFWEFDSSQLLPQKDAEFIIERVLEKGNFKSIKWLFDKYPSSLIHKVVEFSPNLSQNTLSFWSLFFNYA